MCVQLFHVKHSGPVGYGCSRTMELPMYGHTALLMLIFIAIAAAFGGAAWRLLRGPAVSTAAGLGGAACVLGALFFAAWAANLAA